MSKSDASQHIVEYVENCWSSSDQATTDQREVWSELWNAYCSRQDYSNKAGWQSKLFIPKVWMHVERSSAEVRRAMLDVDKLFKLKLDDRDEKAKLAAIRRAMAKVRDPRMLITLNEQLKAEQNGLKDQEAGMMLDEARFKTDLAGTNLAIAYGTMIKAAMLLGAGVIKVGWDTQKRRPSYRHVDLFNYAIDPDWTPGSDDLPRYQVERTTIPLVELKMLATRFNRQAVGRTKTRYDEGAINKIVEDYADPAKEEIDARHGITPHMRVQKMVELKYFWGDIPKDDSSGYLSRKSLVVVANGRYKIRMGPNPYNHGKAPYILTFPILHPHRGTSGSSLIKGIVPMNYAYNNIFNLMMDNLTLCVNKMFQVDTSRLTDSRNLGTIYPGKIWSVKQGQDKSPVIQDIPIGADGIMAALRALQSLGLEIQEADSVTQFLQGMPSGSKTTATEIQVKTMESRGLFEIVAREMEQYSLLPLLEMTWDLLQQFAGYPERDRLYQIKVGGITMLMALTAMIEAIMQTIAMTLKAPDVLGPLTDISLLWRKALHAQNLGDAYKEPDNGMEPLTIEQKLAIEQLAASDARADMQASGQLPQPQPEPQAGPA